SGATTSVVALRDLKLRSRACKRPAIPKAARTFSAFGAEWTPMFSSRQTSRGRSKLAWHRELNFDCGPSSSELTLTRSIGIGLKIQYVVSIPAGPEMTYVPLESGIK